ncbi:hypothetical protein [Hydrogenovibrio kuenenii]|uniref:hypothetical protein n=1 Tax=Hydrogenovibrio kuenenii TaxID=63658 RepID=UPI000464FB7C|nr:hypothetical protein [Hydrogenovibrio kuenenii]
MHYSVTSDETFAAKVPHHIFNINVIITHLAISQVSLELGHGNPYYFILVPLISSMVIAYIYFHGKTVEKTKSWFVAANWQLAWRRSRRLLMAYVAAFAIILLFGLMGKLFGGGLMMNDFTDDGSSSSIVGKIGLYFGALIVFVTVLINFLQTGISVYDAGKGIIDPKIAKYLPRDENANEELGEGDDEVSHDGQKQMDKAPHSDDKGAGEQV